MDFELKEFSSFEEMKVVEKELEDKIFSLNGEWHSFDYACDHRKFNVVGEDTFNSLCDESSKLIEIQNKFIKQKG